MMEGQRALFEPLEPRILLSATPTPEISDVVIEVDAALGQDEPEMLVSEIVFIDTSIEDYQTILAALNRNVEIVYIDANENGIEKITDTLNLRGDIFAIHIISHGSAGQVSLGNTQVSAENLLSHQTSLKTWANALTEDADILIYGCDVGQDLNFVQNLSEISGADVAASNDLTGNAEQDGDWDLEIRQGDIEVDAPFSEVALRDFSELLAFPDGTKDFTGWTGSATLGFCEYLTFYYSTTSKSAFPKAI